MLIYDVYPVSVLAHSLPLLFVISQQIMLESFLLWLNISHYAMTTGILEKKKKKLYNESTMALIYLETANQGFRRIEAYIFPWLSMSCIAKLWKPLEAHSILSDQGYKSVTVKCLST